GREGMHPLVFDLWLIAQIESRLLLRNGYAFHQQQLSCQRAQIAERAHGVFQMIDKPETQHQVKLPQFLQRWIFHVCDVESYCGMPPPCLLNILRACIKRRNYKSHVTHKGG